MYVSGHYTTKNNNPRLVAQVSMVTGPCILEVPLGDNVFRTHYKLDMRCSFYDGR